jgi:ribosomal protein S18 acetylase RimI-like enzyme
MDCGHLLDLRAEIDTPEFRSLLLLLVGWRREPERDGQRLDNAIQYCRSNANVRIFGFRPAGMLDAIVAIEGVGPYEGVIRHIVVRPEARRHGLARELLTQSRKKLNLSTLTAETDRSAAGFYERSGFRVVSLGEKYPGVERFLCTWASRPQEAKDA